MGCSGWSKRRSNQKDNGSRVTSWAPLGFWNEGNLASTRATPGWYAGCWAGWHGKNI
jgi:hypothetical protein